MSYYNWTQIVRRQINAAWTKKSFYFWFLFPLLGFISIIWACVAWIKRFLCSHNKSYDFSVYCVGNVLVGGTGKSPIVRKLALDFCNQGYIVAIIARGMHAQDNIYVASNLEMVFLGDITKGNIKYLSDENREHFELLQAQSATAEFVIFQGKRRAAALDILSIWANTHKNKRVVAILDDGLQDFSVRANHNLVVWDPLLLATSPHWCMPVGPFRESFCFRYLVNNLGMRYWSRTSMLELNKFKDCAQQALAPLGLHLNAQQDVFIIEEIKFFLLCFVEDKWVWQICDNNVFVQFKQGNCFTGIANGNKFYNFSRGFLGISLLTHIELADHAIWDKTIFQCMLASVAIVTTAKDFFRWCEVEEFKKIGAYKPLLVGVLEVSFSLLDGK